jgi:hypothetical protein
MAVLEFNMVISLSKKAYKPGDYNQPGNYGSNKTDPDTEPTYANLFDVSVSTKEGGRIPVTIKSVRRSLFNPKHLEFIIESNTSVNGGTIDFKNKNNGLVVGARRADDVYFNSEKLTGVVIED